MLVVFQRIDIQQKLQIMHGHLSLHDNMVVQIHPCLIVYVLLYLIKRSPDSVTLIVILSGSLTATCKIYIKRLLELRHIVITCPELHEPT